MSDANFVTVAKTSDLEPGQMMYVEVGDEPVCLINLNGEYHAINDICTHQEASLSEGSMEGDEIECPLHGGTFNIRTGEPVTFPVVTAVETYEVRVIGDEVRVSNTARS